MRKLLVGVFLGLLVVIHSSPTDTMTQIPAGTEEDVIEDAMTDGFLVEQYFTTEPPKMNTTFQASQQLYLPNPTEGSGFTASSQTESPEMLTNAQTSLRTLLGEGSGSGMTTSPVTTTPEVSSLDNSVTPTTMLTNSDFLQDGSADSSGDTTYLSTSATTIPTSTMQFVQESVGSVIRGKERSLINIVEHYNKFTSDEDSSKGIHLPQESEKTENGGMAKGHSTPDWIIIVAFLVSLAALMSLCAAIATRDKWNGPDQISVKKMNDSNQKKELEMQTFLHKEEPMENGKESEYTVVPLDDLAECSTD